MKHYKSSAELKDLAKEKLSGRYNITIRAFILLECITYLVNLLLVANLPTHTLPQYTIYLIASALISILLGIFQTGHSLLYLNIACGQPYGLEDIFWGISNNPSRTLRISATNVLISMICLTPCRFAAQLFTSTQNMNYLMPMFLIAGIGLLIYVPASLSISQSYYILLDFPEYSGAQALAASRKLMKGNKGRLFYMLASFLPLMILCSISGAGILLLFYNSPALYILSGLPFCWLIPYMNMTSTLFYLDTMNPAGTDSY